MALDSPCFGDDVLNEVRAENVFAATERQGIQAFLLGVANLVGPEPQSDEDFIDGVKLIGANVARCLVAGFGVFPVVCASCGWHGPLPHSLISVCQTFLTDVSPMRSI